MGNETPFTNDTFGMNVELIGTDLTHFKDLISKPKSNNSIQKFWTFHYDNNISVLEQISTYFEKYKYLKKILTKQKISENVF